MERVDIHVALEICEIVIESATIVAILESGSKALRFRADFLRLRVLCDLYDEKLRSSFISAI
jgi:predicted dinucleotide-utilizing enzyme